MKKNRKRKFGVLRKIAIFAMIFALFVGVQVFANNQTTLNQTISDGSLGVDIVDSGGSTVASPSVSFASKTFSFGTQNSAGTLGVAAEKIRASNPTSTDTWTVNLAGSATTAVWTTGTDTYDFNDASGYTDGGDTDSDGGELTVDPSGGTITGVSGCATTNVSAGASDAFDEGTTDSIDLMSASAGAAAFCRWDLTGVSMSQKIPAGQASSATDYAITMVLSIL